MNFNSLVISSIWPIFEVKDFTLIEEKNIITFKSNKIEIRFTYNVRENSCVIYIGKINNLLYPLSNHLSNKLFNKNIENISQNEFINNCIFIFNSEIGIQILKGNLKFFIEEVEEEVNNFNAELQKNQVLNLLSKNWENKEYEDFLINVKKINTVELPSSFVKKIEIASKKLKQ